MQSMMDQDEKVDEEKTLLDLVPFVLWPCITLAFDCFCSAVSDRITIQVFCATHFFLCCICPIFIFVANFSALEDSKSRFRCQPPQHSKDLIRNVIPFLIDNWPFQSHQDESLLIQTLVGGFYLMCRPSLIVSLIVSFASGFYIPNSQVLPIQFDQYMILMIIVALIAINHFAVTTLVISDFSFDTKSKIQSCHWSLWKHVIKSLIVVLFCIACIRFRIDKFLWHYVQPFTFIGDYIK